MRWHVQGLLGMERLLLPVLNGNGQASVVLARVAVTGDCEAVLGEAGGLAEVMREGFQRLDIGAGVVGGQLWAGREPDRGADRGPDRGKVPSG